MYLVPNECRQSLNDVLNFINASGAAGVTENDIWNHYERYTNSLVDWKIYAARYANTVIDDLVNNDLVVSYYDKANKKRYVAKEEM